MNPLRLAAVSEAAFQAQVTALADLRGWQWAHFRPARTTAGWRTPVSGPLGAGWPDLVLARARDGDTRLIFAELKRERGRLTGAQGRILALLGQLADVDRIQVVVWRPSDLPEIQAVLR